MTAKRSFKKEGEAELGKITIPISPPDGFTWPVDGLKRPRWVDVPGSVLSGLQVTTDGTVRVNPAVPYPPHLTDEWLNKFDTATATYGTFLKMGDESTRYGRWMLVYSAMTGADLDLVRACGMAVIREDPTRHDHWTNLKGLTTALKGDAPLPEPYDVTSCENHFHNVDGWIKRGLDGAQRCIGKVCLIPDGKGGIHRKKERFSGPKSVTYHPPTGATDKEY
ncbi:hypothetical protein ACFWP3_04345 [Streptomyces sp. NPDC058525]|uniref:hypothetical protein n=1 Tax=Streptomyces sp. NPDC058525 TaxID=3346538 RepID=UPI00365CBBF1